MIFVRACVEAVATPAIQSDVRQIMEHPRVQEAFRFLEDNDELAMANLRELTQIPAPPFMEEVRGRRFAEMLTELGADSVWTDEVGNVIGLRRGRGTGTIVFAGHLDTVFPEGTDVSVTWSTSSSTSRSSADAPISPG